MHITNILLLVVGGMNLGLSFAVLLRNPKNRINQAFAASVFFVAGWAIFMAFFREIKDANTVLPFNYLMNICGTLVAPSFYLFSHFFPYQKSKMDKWSKILIIFGTLIMFLVTVFYWIEGIELQQSSFNTGNISILNQYGYAYINIYFISLVTLAFYNLIKKHHESAGFMKKQLKHLILGTLPFGLLGTFVGIIMPWWSFEYLYVGALSALLMFIYISLFLYATK